MPMRNVALVCAAIALVCSVVSFILWRDLHEERQLTLQLRQQMQGMAASAAAAPTVPRILPRPATPTAVTAADQAAVSPVTASAAAAVAAARATATSLSIDRTELLKDPEYRKAALAQARLTLDQNYPGLAEELGLTPAQTQEVFDLLAELQLERTSATFSLTAGGQPDQAAVTEMLRRNQELQRQQDERIAALLGPAGLERFKGYEETRSSRMQAQSVRRTMESAGVPLSDTQMRPLTDAYIAEQRRQRNDMESMMREISQPGAGGQQRALELNMELQEARNRRLVEVARSHLTAQQLERFEASLDQQLAMNRASRRLMQAQLEAQQRQAQQGAQPVTP